MPPGAEPEKKKEVHTLSELKPAAIMSGSTGEKPVETEDKPIEVELNEIQWKYEYKEYPAFYVRAVDGDTIDLILDLGFGIKSKQRVRLEGIDAPEMKGDDLLAGKNAKQFVENAFERNGRCCTVVVKKESISDYDRVIGDIILEDDVKLSEALVAFGKARRTS